MVSFTQWRTSLKKNPKPRQITWLCGAETILIQDVVQHIQDQLQPEPWNRLSFAVGEDSERAIWNALDQYPLGAGHRVVVIKHADQLKRWDRYTEWVKNRSSNPLTYLVLISDEEKIPKTEPTPDERRRGVKPEPLAHIAILANRGHVIECRPFTSATAKHSIPWVQSKIYVRAGVAQHIMERSNFDLQLVRDVCVKLSVLPKGQEVTLTMVNDLMAEQPRDDFADALLAMDRKTALLALEKIQPEEYGRVIGFIDSRLELAGLVHDMLNEHKAPHEIAKAAGAQSWLVPEIMPVAKHYSAKRRLAIRKVLSVVDEAYRSGHRVGLMETLVASW